MQPKPVQWLEATVSSNDGHPLAGTSDYKFDFEAGALPPVYSFWSVSIRDARTRANLIERYSVGDWSEGLVHEDDGSLSLSLQHAPPASGISNWIPTPSGLFIVVLRLYEPGEPVLDGSYVLPLIRISVAEPSGAPGWGTPQPSARPDPDAEIAVIGFDLLPR